MLIARIESSIPLPPPSTRAEALSRFTDCSVRCLDLRPDQVRLALIHHDLRSVEVSGEYGFGTTPWIVVWASLLEGRSQAAIATFIEELSVQVALHYAVDLQAVRVLVQEYPLTHWGVGGALTRT